MPRTGSEREEEKWKDREKHKRTSKRSIRGFCEKTSRENPRLLVRIRGKEGCVASRNNLFELYSFDYNTVEPTLSTL